MRFWGANNRLFNPLQFMEMTEISANSLSTRFPSRDFCTDADHAR
jgi:hypothetical protein